jgi:hemolysin activation/secretion protein
MKWGWCFRYIQGYLFKVLILQILLSSWGGQAYAKNLLEREVDTHRISNKVNIQDSVQYKTKTLFLISKEKLQPIINSSKIGENLIISQGSNWTTPTPPEQQPLIPQPSPEPPVEIPQTPVPRIPSFDIPETITITKFEFIGNSAFSDERLRKETAQFTNRPISFAELVQVETVITKLYVDAGYINSGVVIPADQTLVKDGAVIKVEIVEGGIEDIKVTGTQRLQPNYVRNRIALGASKPLNRNQLVEALQMLQLDPLIENISAELSAGSRPERSLLFVKVTEADSFKTEFFADNGRAPSVGSFRRGVRINQGNLFGFGDALDFKFTNTDGSNAYDLSYTIPLNPRNGTLSLAGVITDTEVIEPPFDRIDITGDSFYIDIGYRQPILRTPWQELALGLIFSRQESKTKLLGEDFPLSLGADENGETRISALRLFQEYTQRSPQEVLALRSQFNVGLGLFNATVNDEPPDGRFFSWRGQGQYVRLLAEDTLLVLRADLQLATRSLAPLEQFSLGGLGSVRGYRQDSLLTDNGFFTSTEVRFPVLRVKQLQGLLQVIPFVDFGVAWNSSGNSSPNHNTLMGVGMGLQWQMGNQFTARIDYGIPLTDVEDDGDNRTLQEDGLYFSVNYSPF